MGNCCVPQKKQNTDQTGTGVNLLFFKWAKICKNYGLNEEHNQINEVVKKILTVSTLTMQIIIQV